MARMLGYSPKKRKMSREARQTWTAKSYERSLRNGRAGVSIVGEFSSQGQLPQTAGRDRPQCRRTIRNVFEVRTKAFSESNSYFLRNSLFSPEVHVPNNY